MLESKDREEWKNWIKKLLKLVKVRSLDDDLFFNWWNQMHKATEKDALLTALPDRYGNKL